MIKKKIIYLILAIIFGIFFGGLVAFCSAETISYSCDSDSDCISSPILSFDSCISSFDFSYTYSDGTACNGYIVPKLYNSGLLVGTLGFGGNGLVCNGGQCTVNITSNQITYGDCFDSIVLYNNSPTCSFTGNVIYTPESTESSVEDLITLLYQGSSTGTNGTGKFKNLFNYGDNLAGTYCIKVKNLSGYSNFSYLYFGFAGSSTSRPSNLYKLFPDQQNNWICLYGNKQYFNFTCSNNSSNNLTTLGTCPTPDMSFDFEVFKLSNLLVQSVQTSCSPGTIDVHYSDPYSQTQTFTCDGDTAIWLSNFHTFNDYYSFYPFMNISYTNEDNQYLLESYPNSILYLENGLFKKTYTGGQSNDWVLSVQGGNSNNTPGIVITGDFPVFDYTGTISTDGLSGNLFTNFTDNALQVLLSNIPGYIQYVFIFGIILFIIGLVKRLRGRRK